MSRILWKQTMLPPAGATAAPFSSSFYGDKLNISRTKAVEFDERSAELPDRRASRTMNRAAMMLSVLGMKGKETIQPQLAKDPFKVGVYFAVENGPVDYDSAYAMKDYTTASFANDYKKNRSPTMYLKQLPNLAGGHFCIFLGITGPYSVFNDSQMGSLHALEQAELDLATGQVAYALVGSAFSFENPLAVGRNFFEFAKNRTLCEGAGLLLLEKSGEITDWSKKTFGNNEDFFGIADPIIAVSKEG